MECATYEFDVDCQLHTLEEIIGFMRTEGLLKKWVFQKEGERYQCKVSLGKSKFTGCGKMKLDQMTDLIHSFLPNAVNIEVSRRPRQWKRDEKVRTGGPWTSWADSEGELPKKVVIPTEDLVPSKTRYVMPGIVRDNKVVVDAAVDRILRVLREREILRDESKRYMTAILYLMLFWLVMLSLR